MKYLVLLLIVVACNSSNQAEATKPAPPEPTILAQQGKMIVSVVEDKEKGNTCYTAYDVYSYNVSISCVKDK